MTLARVVAGPDGKVRRPLVVATLDADYFKTCSPRSVTPTMCASPWPTATALSS